jgi:Tfp pilus assembly protein PilN
VTDYFKPELIVDLSEEFIRLVDAGNSYTLQILSKEFFDAKNFMDSLCDAAESLNLKPKAANLKLILPNKYLFYQTVTLPEDAADKERMTLLNIELDKEYIKDSRFDLIRLDSSERSEANEKVCDYLVCAAKTSIVELVKTYNKNGEPEIISAMPAFYALYPQLKRAKTMTVYLAKDSTEVTLWQQGDPISLSTLQASGDSASDINRYLEKYNEQFEESVYIDKVELYGPEIDNFSSMSFRHPFAKHEDYDEQVVANLGRIKEHNVLKVHKLPRAPIVMNTANMITIGALSLTALLVLTTITLQLFGLGLNSKYMNLKTQADSYNSLLARHKRLGRELADLEKEHSFYLEITRKRAPWNLILTDLAKMTPQQLWFERISAAKDSMTIQGKALSVNDVSALSVNLNYNSKYFRDANIVGTRDYEDRLKYKEFQVNTKLKSPVDKYQQK